MEGKVAIVTGAGSGMGAATAKLFAARGAAVVVADVNEKTGTAVVDEIRGAGRTAEFVAVDLSDEAQVETLVHRTVATFGRLDCAVNNAALSPDAKPIAEVDIREFDRLIAVNLRAVLLCMKHEIRQMLAQGHGGAIVNVGSVSSMRARRGNVGYVASKHAILGLTRCGALDHSGEGIRVNAVLPGTADTPMLRAKLAAIGRTVDDVGRSLSAMGRLADPVEIAEANVWLCSDAASYITGQALAVDGGYLTLAP